MRRIALLSMLLLITGILSMGCESSSLMPDSSKQPRVSCTTYAVPWPNPGASQGTISPFQEYGMRQILYKDGLTEYGRQALYPVTITRFDLSIETYDINQEFKFYVEFPQTSFSASETKVDLPLQNATKIPLSDNGRGPGGILIVPVAFWGPPPAPPNALGLTYKGNYNFKFAVTDQGGRDAVCYASVEVLEKIIEKVKLP